MFNNIYRGKTVLVTGHTGFKGAWLSIWLTLMGAKVVGYALETDLERSIYKKANVEEKIYADVKADLRDFDKLQEVFDKYQPDVVFHLAAQALVKESYVTPKETYETNVMGTINVLEAIRNSKSVKAAIMITSDKCYENIEQIWGYRENDRMGGYDPYSSSKGCCELVVSSWRNSFFNPKDYSKHGKVIVSVRAGNVIGGGDWSENRLIPDCIKAIEQNVDIEIRSPKATRPWEHVLEPLSGYLRLGQLMLEQPTNFYDCFNFGPTIKANRTVLEVVKKVINSYGKGNVVDVSNPNDVHEANLLYVDPTKAYVKLGWTSVLELEEAIDYTVQWYKKELEGDNMYEYSLSQIEKYSQKAEKEWSII